MNSIEHAFVAYVPSITFYKPHMLLTCSAVMYSPSSLRLCDCAPSALAASAATAARLAASTSMSSVAVGSSSTTSGAGAAAVPGRLGSAEGGGCGSVTYKSRITSSSDLRASSVVEVSPEIDEPTTGADAGKGVAARDSSGVYEESHEKAAHGTVAVISWHTGSVSVLQLLHYGVSVPGATWFLIIMRWSPLQTHTLSAAQSHKHVSALTTSCAAYTPCTLTCHQGVGVLRQSRTAGPAVRAKVKPHGRVRA